MTAPRKKTPDPVAEMSEFERALAGAISALLTLSVRTDANESEVEKINDEAWRLADQIDETFASPHDRLYALMFAAFVQIAPAEEMLTGGRFVAEDLSAALRNLADYIDTNRGAQA